MFPGPSAGGSADPAAGAASARFAGRVRIRSDSHVGGEGTLAVGWRVSFLCWRSLASAVVRSCESFGTRGLRTGVAAADVCFQARRTIGVAIDCRAEMSPADDAVG